MNNNTEGEICEATAASAIFGRSANRSLRPDDLTVVHILETLLRPVTMEQCRRLLDLCDFRLRGLGDPTIGEMETIGIRGRAAEKVVALVEFARRFGEEPWHEEVTFRTSYDVYAHFRERLGAALVEYFVVVLLDVKNRTLRDVVVSQGSLTASVVHPREVFLPAIRHAAAGVILVHNHPSGSPEPSPEDLLLTRRLREVGDLIGIRVLDHVIVGRGRYVSMVDDGRW